MNQMQLQASLYGTWPNQQDARETTNTITTKCTASFYYVYCIVLYKSVTTVTCDSSCGKCNCNSNRLADLLTDKPWFFLQNVNDNKREVIFEGVMAML